jgi:hypothetical protein
MAVSSSSTDEVLKSLFYFIKDTVFPSYGFVQAVLNEPLSSEPGAPKIYFAENPRWTYVDETSYPITIKDNGSTVSSSNYTILYLQGQVQFADSYTIQGEIRADYYYDIVDIIEGFPESLEADQTDLPVVAIDVSGRTLGPLSLGQGKFINDMFDIDIFARNNKERDKIADAIEESFDIPLPIIDFSTALPLNDDGSKNTSYDADTQLKSRYPFANTGVIPIHMPEEPSRRRYRKRVSTTINHNRKLVGS